MRAVTNDETPRDRGAVLIWVAALVTVGLAMGAVVLDLGRLYVERRELQNGADAAALAVGQECAGDDTCDEADSPDDIAQSAANGNATDGVAGVAELCGDATGLPACAANSFDPPEGVTGWVRVQTETRTTDGSDEVDMLLAPIFGVESRGVDATAVAGWGPPREIGTLPFIICESKYTQLVEDPEADLPTDILIVYSKEAGNQNDTTTTTTTTTVPTAPPPGSTCPEFPGGGTEPGNFSWLDVDVDEFCQTVLQIDGEVTEAISDQGNDNQLKSKCQLDEDDVLGKTFVVPLFQQTNDSSGNNVVYIVSGFVGFEVTGFKLGGGWNENDDEQCPGASTDGNVRYFCGRFVEKYAVSEGEFDPDPDNDFGVRIVKLIG